MTSSSVYSAWPDFDQMAGLANAAPRRQIEAMTKPDAIPSPEPEQKPKKPEDKPPREIGGPPGPEPTRHGDWAFKGRCTDF